jgi:hypothetical protein
MEEDHEPRIENVLRITPKPDKVNLIDRRGVTDNAEMTTIDAYKKTMHETHQKKAQQHDRYTKNHCTCPLQ